MTKPQTIFRGAHGEQPYFMMLRTTAQDSNLSFEARGIIAYLLSKPNDWQINKSDLMREGNIGRTKMKRVMDELTDAGYMVITQERDENERFMNVVYTLCEQPGAGSTKPVDRKTRKAENVPQHNTESLQDTDNQHKDQKIPAQPEKTDQQLMFEAICTALGIDHKFVTKKRAGTIGKTASEIRAAHGKPEQIPGFVEWLKREAKARGWDDFSEHAMAKYWPNYATEAAPKPIVEIDFGGGGFAEQLARANAAYDDPKVQAEIAAIVKEAGLDDSSN
jgi:hypothetical protein